MFIMTRRPSISTLFPYTTLFRSLGIIGMGRIGESIARRGKLGFNMDVIYYNRRRKQEVEENHIHIKTEFPASDRKSTRLNSSHTVISYAVFCLKKKKTNNQTKTT